MCSHACCLFADLMLCWDVSIGAWASLRGYLQPDLVVCGVYRAMSSYVQFRQQELRTQLSIFTIREIFTPLFLDCYKQSKIHLMRLPRDG